MRIPGHLAVTNGSKLVRRAGSPNLYLELYDPTSGRMRLFSTGTADQAVAEAARARLAAGAEAADAQDAAAQAVAVAAVPPPLPSPAPTA
jgi:hypothetical protein